ncbi:MAG: hypothetical protein K9N51_02430 [Candidatus Pacebacteria bacterium]|nr:hypothetical protein [Candidatus Paceibacterota bacterium]
MMIEVIMFKIAVPCATIEYEPHLSESTHLKQRQSIVAPCASWSLF